MLATSIEAGGLLLVIVFGAAQIANGKIEMVNILQLPESTGALGGMLPVISACALIFFAYMGFEDIANVAEEAENPKQILPKAFLYSLVISAVIYILVAVVAVSVVPCKVLGESDQPLSLVMKKLVGGSASGLIAVVALFATANTVLITLIVGARMLYGMPKEDSMPSLLSWVHSGRKTPWMAVIVMAGFSMVFLSFKKIEILASISDVGIFILFLNVNLSNILLRFRMPEEERQWKVPFAIKSIPIPSVLGAITCILMLLTINHPVEIAGREMSSLFVALILFAIGLPLYFLVGWRKPSNHNQ